MAASEMGPAAQKDYLILHVTAIFSPDRASWPSELVL